MKAVNIKIKTKNNSYSIVIGNNLIKSLMKVLKRNSLDFNRCLIIVDKNVPILIPKVYDRINLIID